ncbi:MAG TPA: thiol:disulfide interchange protein DsbA/DsbL [Woeseiaceae bacterium]|nr:thiol:disulfide interchange protein DsbA/DsbL [Woeseiaceae bacterium]
MNHPLTIGLFLALALAGCGSGQDTESTERRTIEERAASETQSATQEEPVAVAPDDELEVVEESAAVQSDTQSEEQPIMLAQAEQPQSSGDWKFSEGRHFQRLVPTQPTVGGADKIEVAEFFWYGCAHCLDFEPHINRWAGNIPANVRFVYIPAMWNPLVKLHGQLYYTEEVLAKNGKIENPEAFRAAVFNEYHRRGNRLTSESAIQSLFERFDVSAEDFQKTWKSFEVDQKMRVAEDLARRYSISGVPAIVVAGKYRTGAGEAGGYPALLELIDELVARESAR